MPESILHTSGVLVCNVKDVFFCGSWLKGCESSQVTEQSDKCSIRSGYGTMRAKRSECPPVISTELQNEAILFSHHQQVS